MFFPKSLPTCSEFMAVKGLDKIFLHQFNSESENVKVQKIKNLINQGNTDLIVKLSCEQEDDQKHFREICLKDELAPYWASLWSTYGIILTGKQEGALYDQPNMCKFDLFLGIFFYHKAMQWVKYSQKPYSGNELSYLKKAMQYGSIHAYQRYYSYLYENFPATSSEETRTILEGIISDIKLKLLPDYGAYAYLMLAQAYIHYASLTNLNAPILSAINICCALARKTYANEKGIFFNASLAETLNKDLTSLLDPKHLENIFLSLSTTEGQVKPDMIG